MPLLPIALGSVLGILLSFVSGERSAMVILILVILFSTALLSLIFANLFQKNKWKNQLVVISWSLFFVLIGFTQLALSKARITPLEEVSGKINFGTVFKSRISESGYQTIHISLDKQVESDKQLASEGNIILTLDTLEAKYRTGDYIAFKTNLEPFRNETNPGSFDAQYYYGTHYYIGRAFIASNCISRVGSTHTISIFFSKWQDQVAGKLKAWLPGSVSGIAVALLVGNKADIDQEVLDSFSNTGAMHVLAVSGLHVGIILVIFQTIMGFFSKWISRKQAIVFSVILIWGFGLLSGASPSVIRAVVMFSILALGQLLSRENHGMNNLVLSALLLLMYDPYYLFDIGFQLSYAALIGILLFQDPIYRLWHIPNNWLDWLWKGTVVGIAATIATIPFMLYWFHQFPNYFLLSNLVVMLLGFIVLLLLIILIFTAWVPYLNFLVIFLTALSLEILVIGIKWVNEIPGGVSGGFELNFWQFLIAGTLIAVSTYLFLVRQTISKPALAGMLLCLAFISWKREAKLQQNEFRIFSSKHFCGTIQFDGQIIAFSESPFQNKQVRQTLKNAVRDSGLKLYKKVLLQANNKIRLGNQELRITRVKNGWQVLIGSQKWYYRTHGIPGKRENKQLMSAGLQQALYKNEAIVPFKQSI